jgi:hypothetical protein
MNDRRHSQPKDVLSFGPFSLFAAERLLKKAEEPIPLGGRALDILIALAERAGEVVTHKELISTVWPDVTVEEANLRFQMAAFGRRLVTGETARGTYPIFPAGVIVLLRRSQSDRPCPSCLRGKRAIIPAGPGPSARAKVDAAAVPKRSRRYVFSVTTRRRCKARPARPQV